MTADKSLVGRALVRMGLGIVVIGALLFVPAETLRYWPGWMFLATFMLPAMFMGGYLLRRDPALLERRLQAGEREPDQRKMLAVTNTLFLVGFMLPGLDFRFGWSHLPAAVMIVADVFVFVGYLLVAWVLRTNSYAARTIQVEQEQQVIDSGPYKYVRHPMYSGLLLMMVAAPLALGSLWSLPLFAVPLPPLLAWRIRGEERVLREQLPGYADYCERVRWRLVPGVW